MSYIIDRDGKIVDAWYGVEEGEPRAIAALQKRAANWQRPSGRMRSDQAAKAAPEVAVAAKRLFDAIRAADYSHDWMSTKDWKRFPAKDVDYCVDHDYPGWVRWVCAKVQGKSHRGSAARQGLRRHWRLSHGPFRVAAQGRRGSPGRPAVPLDVGEQAVGRLGRARLASSQPALNRQRALAQGLLIPRLIVEHFPPFDRENREIGLVSLALVP